MVSTTKILISDKTQKKHRKQNDNLELWKPGVSANPLGRPKGSRNKLSEAVLKDILADWEVAGPSAIQACRLEDPAAYLRVVTSLVPKEFNVKEGESVLATILEQFSGDQLDEVLVALATGSSRAKGEGHKVKTLPGSQPNGVY